MSMSAPRLTPALLLLLLRAGAQHLDNRSDVRQNLCNRTEAVMAGAEMLAAIQILVYLGSVMLVVQFGVMLTRKQIQEDA